MNRIHHQPDHFARREVITGGLVGQFVELADEVLEDEPHLLIGHRPRMQVHIAELGNDEVKDVGLAHPLDLGFKLEVVEDAADVGRETLDVADEVLLDVVGVALQLLEIERRVVVEALTGGLVECGVKGIALKLAALAAFVRGQHLALRGREHAVEPPEHGHGQHDALVLRWAVRAAQQVGDLPDQVGEVIVVRHRSVLFRRAAQVRMIVLVSAPKSLTCIGWIDGG